MPTAEEISWLENQVVLLGLAIGLLLGWVSQYARFCTLGAISDWATMGNTSRLRMWMLAVAVAIFGTQSLVLAGEISLSESFYVAPRLFWLSNIVGGVVFGFGMALASGCGSRTLIRIGGGSLKALVIFLVMAIFAYMAMRGIFGVLRVNTIEKISIVLATPQDLTSIATGWFGFSPATVRLALAIAIASLLALIAFVSRDFRDNPRYIAGGIVIGLLVVAGWWTTGHLGFVEEDPNTLEPRFLATNTRGIESLTFVAPLAYWWELFMFWSDTSKGLTFSIATVFGVMAGSFIHAIASGDFRWEGFKDREDLVYGLAGGALMGVGGVIAFGCTIGQGISGVSTLAVGSILALVSIVAGGWLGVSWMVRRA